MPTRQGESLPGAERPTLIERVIHLAGLPYWLGSLALGLLIGFPGLLLGNYMDSWNLDEAVRDIFLPYSGRPAWTGILDVSVNTFIIFYMLIMIRFMRLKLIASEPNLTGLTQGGEKTLHKIFGRVSNTRPQLISAITLFVLIQAFFSLSGGVPTALGTVSPQTVLLFTVTESLFYLTVGTFVWVYSSSLWGLHKFGKEPLKLKPFYEDRMLGVGVVGTLSLGLAFAYYTVFGPVAVESIILSPDIVGYATLFPFVALGGIMFFLPLNSIHLKMLKEKRHQEEFHRRQLVEVFNKPNNPGSTGDDQLPNQVEKLLKLEMLQIAEKGLEKVPSWPFDKETLERFAAIFFPVLTALLTRIGLFFFGS